MKKTFLLLILLCFSGCLQNNKAKNITQYREMAIKSALNNEGYFVKENNLLQHHQFSNIEWNDTKGNVVKSYTYSERKLGVFSYVPILSFLLQRDYENYEIIITLKNGSMLDVKSFYGIVTLESESYCNEAIFSCVIKVK